MGNNIFPLRTAFPIWMSYNKKCEINTKRFTTHPSLKEVAINEWTGEYALPGQKAIHILV
ncbi:hypothetical protein Noda2021_08890 [Candidatus Dependentiae bacterium Noda2021]|nr:hypothetical protein Noda2021_08890 [Candidatus Dependentiae bacterium Noda2021]